jgi:hypothetical protein
VPPVNRDVRPVGITYAVPEGERGPRASSHTHLNRAVADAFSLVERYPRVTGFTAAGTGTPMFTITADRGSRTVRVEQLGDSDRAVAGAAFVRRLLADGVTIWTEPMRPVVWRLAAHRTGPDAAPA